MKIEGEEIILTLDDVEIISSEIEGWVVESEEGITVAIDAELTEDLIAEGYAREVVNRIQNIRKDSGFDVMDKIKITYKTNDELSSFINKFSDYIKNETLADLIESGEPNDGYVHDFDLGDYQCSIAVQKSE